MAKKGEKNPVRLPHAAARIEFLALLDEIIEFLNKGHSWAGLYRKLRDEQKITMALRTFQALCESRLKKSDDPSHLWEPAPPKPPKPRKNAKKKAPEPPKKQEESPPPAKPDDDFAIIKKPKDEIF